MAVMSVTRALGELKLLDARINSVSGAGVFVAVAKGDKKLVVGSTKSADEISNFIQASYDSVVSLIKRREEIKAKIILSNAETKVYINGVDMTVAEAIEKKNSITLQEAFLGNLRAQYQRAQANFSQLNQNMELSIDQKTTSMFSSDKTKVSAEQLAVVSEVVRKEMQPEMIDPIKILEKIQALDESIRGFKSEVDYVLSESNAKTMINLAD